jgi:hypothetical protein
MPPTTSTWVTTGVGQSYLSDELRFGRAGWAEGPHFLLLGICWPDEPERGATP